MGGFRGSGFKVSGSWFRARFVVFHVVLISGFQDSQGFDGNQTNLKLVRVTDLRGRIRSGSDWFLSACVCVCMCMCVGVCVCVRVCVLLLL